MKILCIFRFRECNSAESLVEISQVGLAPKCEIQDLAKIVWALINSEQYPLVMKVDSDSNWARVVIKCKVGKTANPTGHKVDKRYNHQLYIGEL